MSTNEGTSNLFSQKTEHLLKQTQKCGILFCNIIKIICHQSASGLHKRRLTLQVESCRSKPHRIWLCVFFYVSLIDLMISL